MHFLSVRDHIIIAWLSIFLWLYLIAIPGGRTGESKEFLFSVLSRAVCEITTTVFSACMHTARWSCDLRLRFIYLVIDGSNSVDQILSLSLGYEGLSRETTSGHFWILNSTCPKKYSSIPLSFNRDSLHSSHINLRRGEEGRWGEGLVYTACACAVIIFSFWLIRLRTGTL